MSNIPNETIVSISIKLSDGNPGAATVLAKLVKHCVEQNPPVDFIPYLAFLDKNKITGSQIWVLYKDYCGSKIEDFHIMLQLGITSLSYTKNLKEIASRG
jgi:hypothetical protein